MSLITAIESVLKVLDDAATEVAAIRAKKAAQDAAQDAQLTQQEKDLPPEPKE